MKQVRHPNRSSLINLSLFAISLFLFTYGIRSQEVIGFDSRFYLFAREMWQQGWSWFPTTYFEPYPDYPGTAIWLMNLSAYLLGGVSKLSALLPSAIAAAITVVFTYQIGALFDKKYGLTAVAMLFLTFAFMKSARAISLDMYPTCFTAICFYLVLSADKLTIPTRIKWIFPLFILSFCFRGPIGLVIPTGVVCTYYLLSGQIKKLFLVGIIATCLLAICTAILLVLAYHVGGDNFMQDVLRMQVLGRIDNYYRPYYFYFTDSLASYALTFPFALLVLITVLFARFFKQQPLADRHLLWQFMGSVLIILIGMSIPGDKKVRYILAITPALGLIVAYPFFALDKHKKMVFLQHIFEKIVLVLPSFFLVLIGLSQYLYPQKLQGFALHFAALITIFILLQALNIIIFFKSHTPFLAIFFTGAASFYIANLGLLEPIELQIEPAKVFVQSVENLRKQAHALLVFYKERPDGLPIKYRTNMPQLSQPIFIADEKALAAFKEPAFFICSEEYYVALPENLRDQFRVIMQNTIGHVPMVVFTQNYTSHSFWTNLWRKTGG